MKIKQNNQSNTVIDKKVQDQKKTTNNLSIKKSEKEGACTDSDSIKRQGRSHVLHIVITIITAIVAGLVVALCTPSIQDWHYETKKIRDQDDNLEKIQNGMCKGHIDEVFGNPLFVNNVNTDYTIEAGGQFISAAYKLHEKSLLCLYQDETLVAFAVMTKRKDQYTFQRYGLYEQGTDPADFTYTISQFTYKDYNDSFIEDFKGFYPLMGSYHIHYYYEVSGGYHPNNYEYTILGTYRNYMDNSEDVVALMEEADLLGNPDQHGENDPETVRCKQWIL